MNNSLGITEEDHKKRHIELYESLNELLEDFTKHNKPEFMDGTIVELVRWASNQRFHLDHKLTD